MKPDRPVSSAFLKRSGNGRSRSRSQSRSPGRSVAIATEPAGSFAGPRTQAEVASYLEDPQVHARVTTQANLVVAAFVKKRQELDLETDREKRDIIGKYARQLLLGPAGRYSAAILVYAAQEFAATKKHPRFLEEWANAAQSKLWALEDDVQRAEQSRIDRLPLNPQVAALIAGVTTVWDKRTDRVQMDLFSKDISVRKCPMCRREFARTQQRSFDDHIACMPVKCRIEDLR